MFQSRTIAIVGGGFSKKKAPLDSNIEKWILPVSAPHLIPYAARAFEFHSDIWDVNSQSWRNTPDPKGCMDNYKKMLKSIKCPLYMTKPSKDIPMSRPFPFVEIVSKFGFYFDNSISYMIAMAIDEFLKFQGNKELHFYGVDFNEERHTFQKGVCEYYVGMATTLGIKIFVSHGSSLLKTHDGLLYGINKKPEQLIPEITEQQKELRALDMQAQGEAMLEEVG